MAITPIQLVTNRDGLFQACPDLVQGNLFSAGLQFLDKQQREFVLVVCVVRLFGQQLLDDVLSVIPKNPGIRQDVGAIGNSHHVGQATNLFDLVVCILGKLADQIIQDLFGLKIEVNP